MAKGGEFERQICKDLSTWWAGRDDIFWRSSNSGGRATVRGKKGKKTSGQYGDVAAIDPAGIALLDGFTIELKRGYSKSSPVKTPICRKCGHPGKQPPRQIGGHTIHDLLDRTDHRARHQLLDWMEQAKVAHTNAGSFTWMLIHQRDRRDALVFMTPEGWAILSASCKIRERVRFTNRLSCVSIRGRLIFVFRFEEMLRCVNPKKLRRKLKLMA